MNLDQTRKAKLTILTALYYTRPRKDSLPRFIRRLGRKPRYQSLLRGAQRSKRFMAMGHLEDCVPGKCGKECAHGVTS